MDNYLILKLEGVLQGWGTHTYEDYRPSNLFPTYSGLLGLLAACLGIERQDQDRLGALARSLTLAVRADYCELDGQPLKPTKLTDFHTVSEARKVDGKVNKYPVVSRREYLCDAKFTVAIRVVDDAELSLKQLQEAVQKPVYTPFLGRRACPLSRPLFERVVQADSFVEALAQIAPYRGTIYCEEADKPHSRLLLRDVPLLTGTRQFTTRHVHIQVAESATGQGGDHVSQ